MNGRGKRSNRPRWFHEAWMKLVDAEGHAQFNSRGHFFGAAAEAMRRILIDRARRKRAIRHGGGQHRVDIEDVEITAEIKDDELLALDEALANLPPNTKRRRNWSNCAISWV